MSISQNSKNPNARTRRTNLAMADPEIPDSAPTAQPSQSKLLVTVATKIGEDQARRFRQIVVSSGMTDAQLFRLILDRADVLFQKWDERINPRFFVGLFELKPEQLTLFNIAEQGNLRLKR